MDKKVSKNESLDRTVDEKLGKWREKSIKLEEQRRLEEESQKNQAGIKNFMYHYDKIITAAAVAAIVLIVLCVCIFNGSRVNMSKYISVEYNGINGYATAQCVVDTEQLYTKLAGKTQNTEKLDRYREFVDSIEVQTDNTDIANGTKVAVNVIYDSELAKQLGISMKNTSYTVKAKGIESGTQIDLYSNVEVIFAGISPDAYVVITNKWTDDYLKNLTFTADKSTGIAKNDTIVITCSDDYDTIARHGYIIKSEKAKVTADSLSTYVEEKEQFASSLGTIDKESKAAIVSETEDVTFRMLYQATKNSSYLRSSNEETAQDIQNMGIYFLKKKNDTADTDNYLYYFYKATISNGSEQEEVYFLFEYSNGYVKNDGAFEIEHSDAARTYYCAADFDELYNQYIAQKEKIYTITKVG